MFGSAFLRTNRDGFLVNSWVGGLIGKDFPWMKVLWRIEAYEVLAQVQIAVFLLTTQLTIYELTYFLTHLLLYLPIERLDLTILRNLVGERALKEHKKATNIVA